MSVQAVSPVVEAVAMPQSDAEAERRYVEVLNTLHDEAADQRKFHVLADCLAWALARVLIRHGSFVVAGDVLRWLGFHVKDLAERVAAQREAEEARQAGHQPN